MSLTRKEAIEDIRMGRGIMLPFTGIEQVRGRAHTFRVIIRRNIHPVVRKGVRYVASAAIECDGMRRCYYVDLTAKQVLAYIRRHYDRFDDCSKDIPELARVA